MGTCKTCHWYLPYSTGCLKIERGNRRMEIEMVKKGLIGECDDYVKYKASK